MKELIYKGSTKDIYQVSEKELVFKFSNRYSIFDYGEMPDIIPQKGESTALFTFNLFTSFEKELGIKTHLIKRGEANDELIVRKFFVPRNENNQAYYEQKPTNTFVPLEVIFRFGVPKGSSLLSRSSGPQYYEGQIFEEPLIEFSTKLESIDRLINYTEAQKIAGLDSNELEDLLSTTKKLALHLKNKIDSKGAFLWDGKFEFAFGEKREFILVDSISLDELRITLQGFPLSKEILRQIYKNLPWYEELTFLKKENADTFREKVTPPAPLNKKTIELVSALYINAQALITKESSKDSKQENEYLNQLIMELKNEYSHCW